MKTDVICDTNIWYYLGDGTIDPNSLKDYSLIATFYNFEELITTPNNLTNFQQVRRAAKAIVNYSSKQYLENAFLYLANQITPNYEDTKYGYNLGIRNWAEIRRMAALDDSFQLTPELKAEYEKNAINRGKQGQQVAQIENDFVTNVKAHSKKVWKTNSSKYFKERFKGILLELNDYLKMFSDGRIEMQGKHIKQVELFLTAFLQFSKNTEVAKWVVKPNDAYDLYNLIYVKPGSKYFTRENRWKNLIAEAGLDHYLLHA
ncbi:hypothetical protein [Ohtaekwangia koreensis]|uniref:Uncharacterized protein n=1 Tax=Ohtaekwangia koreensis TaxID=688867 RepID=A0A1T5J7B7_9BACT|nr:hypothetical protein [Ohtaekwangia koreensis]SKC47143.1 hypothetical protein SAMN05660236_0823 [Ohtaekwangia koreensis]